MNTYKKLLLVRPQISSVKIQYMEPLSLGYLAALTPKNWEVSIVDENFESIDFNEKYDLVGISTYTHSITRAYELSAIFRNKKIPVVLGGIHASFVSDEASNYADSIVIGEADAIWEKVILDCERNNLQKKYYGKQSSLEKLSAPRRDLFRNKYAMAVLETSRGCPFECEFCYSSFFWGKKRRYRPIDKVLEELETIKQKNIIFVDDNFLGCSNKQRKEELKKMFDAMIKRKINKWWTAFASIDVVNDPELLTYAYKSGCRMLYIGVESVSVNSLKEMNKKVIYQKKLEDIKTAIKTIRKYKIVVMVGFIVGNDGDDNCVFQDIVKFVKEAGIDLVDLHFLVPYPGTKLWDRLKEENRLIYNDFPNDWHLFNETNIVFKPKNLSIMELAQGFNYIHKKKYSITACFFQFFKTLIRTRNIIGTFMVLEITISYMFPRKTANKSGKPLSLFEKFYRKILAMFY